MRILFVVNEVPYPPDNGVRIVSHNAMRLMKESGHALGVAVLTVENDQVESRLRHVSALCEENSTLLMKLAPRSRLRILVESLIKNRMFPIERYSDKLFEDKLRKLIAEFRPDVVHFDIITMTQYRNAVPPGVGTVASINDSYSLTLINMLESKQYGALQHIYRKFQLFQARYYENVMYEKFSKVHVMTDVDADYLHQLNMKINTTDIPNGVNDALFDVGGRNINSFDVIFVAKMVGDNIYSLRKFMEICWPLISESSPETKLYIVGKLGDEAANVYRMVRNCRNVNVMGYVEKLEDVYAKCGIAIVPIDKNCGIMNKTIEAMAAGLVVVGFERSFSGIKGVIRGEHYVSVDDYPSMGPAVVKLIRDEEQCKKIKSAAREYSRANFSWEGRASAYENMYSEAMNLAKAELA